MATAWRRPASSSFTPLPPRAATAGRWRSLSSCERQPRVWALRGRPSPWPRATVAASTAVSTPAFPPAAPLARPISAQRPSAAAPRPPRLLAGGRPPRPMPHGRGRVAPREGVAGFMAAANGRPAGTARFNLKMELKLHAASVRCLGRGVRNFTMLG